MFNCVSQKNINLPKTQLTNSTSIPFNKDHFKDYKNHLKNIEKGILQKEALATFKKYTEKVLNINMDSTNYLAISYLKSKSDCWYNNISNLNNPKSKINTDKLKEKVLLELVFLHFNNKKSSFSTIDQNQLIHNMFSKNYKVCDFTIVIDKNGNYFFKASHFYPNVTNAMLLALKRENTL